MAFREKGFFTSYTFTVVLKFPCIDALRAWRESREYMELINPRADNTECTVVFADCNPTVGTRGRKNRNARPMTRFQIVTLYESLDAATRQPSLTRESMTLRARSSGQLYSDMTSASSSVALAVYFAHRNSMMSLRSACVTPKVLL